MRKPDKRKKRSTPRDPYEHSQLTAPSNLFVAVVWATKWCNKTRRIARPRTPSSAGTCRLRIAASTPSSAVTRPSCISGLNAAPGLLVRLGRPPGGARYERYTEITVARATAIALRGGDQLFPHEQGCRRAQRGKLRGRTNRFRRSLPFQTLVTQALEESLGARGQKIKFAHLPRLRVRLARADDRLAHAPPPRAACDGASTHPPAPPAALEPP